MFRATVVDESGGSIAGAMVSVRDAAGIVKGRSTSDENGGVTIPGLAAGRYTVEAVKDLFETVTTAIDLRVNRQCHHQSHGEDNRGVEQVGDAAKRVLAMHRGELAEPALTPNECWHAPPPERRRA